MMMTTLLNRTMVATVATILTATSSFAQCSLGGKSAKTQHDIVDTAVEAGQFDTLVAAVKAAGLVDVLKSDGPFTVFAPTDEAFAKVPKDTLDALVRDKAKLQKVLTYHVLTSKWSSDDIRMVKSTGTALGPPVTFGEKNGSLTVNDAVVVKADVDCANGVIHVIDTVLMPK